MCCMVISVIRRIVTIGEQVGEREGELGVFKKVYLILGNA